MHLIELLQTNGTLLSVIVAAVGLTVGSFLNVVILRLPAMLEREWRGQCREFLGVDGQEEGVAVNLVSPPSHCPHCKRPIRPWENIPLLSYLLLRGRCKGCGAAISLQYPLVEAATALLSVAVAWRYGFTVQLAAALPFTWALIAAAVIDLRTQLLPDNITLPLLWAGLFLSLYGLFADSHHAIVGALAGYLSLWSVYQLFKRLTGKEGMGFGDFKLLAAIGAWAGWQALPAVVILSSLVGAVVGGGLMLFRGHGRNVPIPFGPYLAAAGWLGLLWGDALTAGYLRWALAP